MEKRLKLGKLYLVKTKIHCKSAEKVFDTSTYPIVLWPETVFFLLAKDEVHEDQYEVTHLYCKILYKDTVYLTHTAEGMRFNVEEYK